MSSCASPKAKDKFVLEHEMGSVDKADKLVGKHGSTLLSQAIERKCVEDMVADLWNHHSKLNEALCSNGDQWGVYQTPTTGSFVKLWNGLLAYPWFKELGEKRLKNTSSTINVARAQKERKVGSSKVVCTYLLLSISTRVFFFWIWAIRHTHHSRY